MACLMHATGCAVFKKQLLSRKYSKVPEDKSNDVFIGIVESVNPEQKFVLIRTELRIAVTPGTVLESHAMNGAKASLVVTPERKMNFLSADVREGVPAAGDVVVLPAHSTAPAPVPAGGSSPVPQDATPGTPALRLPEP